MSKLTTFLGSAAAVVVLSVYMTTTAAATPWTFTTTGTISTGYDTTGVFGAANTDLYGMSFSNSITLDPTAYANIVYNDADANSRTGTLTGSATTTVTVGNTTKTFIWDLSSFYNWGQSYLGAYNTNYGAGMIFDEAYQNQSGYTADGSNLVSYGYLYSYVNAFGLSTSFNQNWARTVQAGDYGGSYFYIYGNSGYASFQGTPSTISINSPVPEPEAYAMLLAGLGLLSFTAKRRKQAV